MTCKNDVKFRFQRPEIQVWPRLLTDVSSVAPFMNDIMAELSTYDRDHMAPKDQNLYYCGLCKRSVLVPALHGVLVCSG